MTLRVFFEILQLYCLNRYRLSVKMISERWCKSLIAKLTLWVWQRALWFWNMWWLLSCFFPLNLMMDSNHFFWFVLEGLLFFFLHKELILRFGTDEFYLLLWISKNSINRWNIFPILLAPNYSVQLHIFLLILVLILISLHSSSLSVLHLFIFCFSLSFHEIINEEILFIVGILICKISILGPPTPQLRFFLKIFILSFIVAFFLLFSLFFLIVIFFPRRRLIF